MVLELAGGVWCRKSIDSSTPIVCYSSANYYYSIIHDSN